MCGTYIRGRLTLAGVDLSLDIGAWLDAVYSAWMDAPHEQLKKAMEQMVLAQARVRPKEARETWGLRPEHQMMGGRLTAGPAPAVGPKAGPTAQAEAMQRAQQKMRRGR